MKYNEATLELLKERNERKCEEVWAELNSRPLGSCDPQRRLEAHQQVINMGLSGHYEAVTLAHLVGIPNNTIAEQFRITPEKVREIIKQVQRIAENYNKKGDTNGC